MFTYRRNLCAIVKCGCSFRKRATTRIHSHAHRTSLESKPFVRCVRACVNIKSQQHICWKTPINFTIVDNLLSNYMLETWAQLMRMHSKRKKGRTRRRRSILLNRRCDDRKRLLSKIIMAHNFFPLLFEIDNRRLYFTVFCPQSILPRAALLLRLPRQFRSIPLTSSIDRLILSFAQSEGDKGGVNKVLRNACIYSLFQFVPVSLFI